MRVLAGLLCALAIGRDNTELRVEKDDSGGFVIPGVSAPSVSDTPTVTDTGSAAAGGAFGNFPNLNEAELSLAAEVQHVADEAHTANEMGDAVKAETEAIRDTTNKLSDETTVEVAENQKIKHTYNDEISPLYNGVNQEIKLNGAPTVNHAAASLNEEQEEVGKVSAGAKELEAEIQAFNIHMRQVEQSVNNQIARHEHTCTGLDIWTKHADPIIELEQKALDQVEAWTNHVEGEMTKVAAMLKKITHKLHGESTDIIEELEQEEIALAEGGEPGSDVTEGN